MKIRQGRSNNASEVICVGLRLLEENENYIIELKAAIEDGIISGTAFDFNSAITLQHSKRSELMTKFHFSRKAVDDLSDIWNHTTDEWAEIKPTNIMKCQSLPAEK